ncbi:HAMP domain-containing sensor histidine kinase [Bacillus sp. SM2101]|uniref:HAMP domain-containing sensor histidine kinase n=1 Tax=Bacillus sp. SM2101 TaxID=2805366 RepID=UPI001BDE3F62|nr:HAMP domain-containing sensor histidine kinase [Bacillus sp. SM2101]
MKFRHSLQAKYIIIICLAIMLVPFAFPLTIILINLPFTSTLDNDETIYTNSINLENMWHEEAAKLAGASDETIDTRLHELSKLYPDATMFWVDGTGKTRLTKPIDVDIQNQWSASNSIAFIKQTYDKDPFTIIAFIGESTTEGFIIFQIQRDLMLTEWEKNRDQFEYIIYLAVIILMIGFIVVSWLFFRSIRKRLISLQQVMTHQTADGIPEPILIQKKDEIAQLEEAFNQMIYQLKQSREKEKEEEQLRKQLIANLSHDLRTPLTTIRGHTHSLNKEELSTEGEQSITIINDKIDYLSQLIDNLLSFTLISSNKYPYNPEKIDILRIVRSSVASWYPIFEKEGFVIEVNLPEQQVQWVVDKQWFTRILDNLLQNVYRHAQAGKYVGISIINQQGKDMLIIKDKGPGMNAESQHKGAKVGLSIVHLMLQKMEISVSQVSDEHGTIFYLSQNDYIKDHRTL